MPKDRVFQLRDGWYCIVNGQTFGTWATKAIAKAGMEVERRRARQRDRKHIKNVPWTPHPREEILP